MQSEDLQADRRIGKRQALQQGFRTLPLRQVLSDDTPLAESPEGQPRYAFCTWF